MLALLPVFGDLERLISEDLYPYRYIITPLLGLGVAALAAFAISKGVHKLLLEHRVATTVVGVPALILAVIVGDYLLSPLWERNTLIEASPIESTTPAAVDSPASAESPSSTPTAQSAGVLSTGEFEGADDFHFGRGKALLIRGEDGANYLRFEDFSVRNGPDLYVYVSRDTDGKRVEEGLNLGRLKATDGAFNYEIPSSIDVAEVRSVLVWCRQFSVLFAIAELEL